MLQAAQDASDQGEAGAAERAAVADQPFTGFQPGLPDVERPDPKPQDGGGDSPVPTAEVAQLRPLEADVSLRQRLVAALPAVMHDDRRRHVADAPPGLAQPPAQIELFAVHEK